MLSVCKWKWRRRETGERKKRRLSRGQSLELGPGRRKAEIGKGSERIPNNTPADGAELRTKKQSQKSSKQKKKTETADTRQNSM